MFKNPFGHSEPQEDTKSQEESLTTILATPEQRSELTLLLANCTECMRKVVVDTFDAKKKGDGDGGEEQQLKGDDALWAATPEAVANVDVEAQEKERQEQAKEAQDLSGPAFEKLKEGALKHFDGWRDSVLQRVGEVVNSRHEAEEQKEEARPSSPSSMPPFSRRHEPERYDEGVSKALNTIFPPQKNPLVKEVAEDKRKLVLQSMLLLLLSLEHYSAHSRILLLYLSNSLELPIDFLAELEGRTARGLIVAAEQMNADEETKKRAKENESSRKWKVGLASAAGAAIIGITGGLAAPLLAAGLGSVMGGLGLAGTATAGYLGSLASSTVLVGGLFGAYGGRMTGRMMDQYAKEVPDFAFVPVRSNHRPRKIEKEYRRLRVAIGISGWLTEQKEVYHPWRVIGKGEEAFGLQYELENMMKLGNSLSIMLKSAAWGYAKKEIISRTVFSSLSAGLWPIGLLKVSRVLDNPFSVARARSDKAGIILADALINKAQGERPVTLIGYSLGARVIYQCLLSLAERGAFGLVESVVLLGAPVPSTSLEWRKMRSVVAGRLVNCYSEDDYILGFLYRVSSFQYGIAGLQEIRNVKGVENADISDIVSGHTQYRFLTGSILKRIGFEDVVLEEVQAEEEALAAAEKEEQAERAKAEQHESSESVEKKDEEQQTKAMEEKVEEKQKESMVAWTADKLRAGGASAASALSQAKAQLWSSGEDSKPAKGEEQAPAKIEERSGEKDTSKPQEKSGDQAPAKLEESSNEKDGGKAQEKSEEQAKPKEEQGS